MKKSELIAAAKDLNAVLGLEPAIDLKQDVAKIKQLVTQAAELVEPTDTLAPVTELVFAELGVGPAAAEEAPKGKAKAAPKAAPKGKAKAKPAPEPDEDEVEEDDYDDDEITVIDDPTPAPAPKAKGKGKAAAPKAKAEPKAKAAPKAPAKTRLVAAVEAIQALSPDDSSSIDELVAEADAIYGTTNVAEARQMTRQALTVLEAWGAIAIVDGVVTVL